MADTQMTERRNAAIARGVGMTTQIYAERAENARLLHGLLAELDDDKREAFILVDIEQVTAAEAAEALGANPNTVASRVRAARRELGRRRRRRSARRQTASAAWSASPAEGAGFRACPSHSAAGRW